jgi:hypothetical protein
MITAGSPFARENTCRTAVRHRRFPMACAFVPDLIVMAPLHKYGCRVVLEFFFVASTLADKASTWSKEKTRRYPTVKIELAASVYYEHIPHHTTRKPDGSLIIAESSINAMY